MNKILLFFILITCGSVQASSSFSVQAEKEKTRVAGIRVLTPHLKGLEQARLVESQELVPVRLDETGCWPGFLAACKTCIARTVEQEAEIILTPEEIRRWQNGQVPLSLPDMGGRMVLHLPEESAMLLVNALQLLHDLRSRG
jgi:hypothetical protein